MADSAPSASRACSGWPVAHSRSPVIHNHWLAQYGIPGRYVLFPVPPEKLEAAVRGIAALGLARLQRHHAAQAGDLSAARSRRRARARIGAVQHGRRREGRHAHRLQQRRQRLHPEPARRRPRSGVPTAGRSSCWARAARRAPSWRASRRRVRTRSASPTARSTRRRRSPTPSGPAVKVVPWEQRADALDGVAMLANATSLGMAGKPPLDISLDRLPKHALVGDLIYVPPETPLLAAARARGNVTVNGLGLLLNQARPAFNAWFGVMPEITPALRAGDRGHVLSQAQAHAHAWTDSGSSTSRRSTATCTCSIRRAFPTAPTRTTARGQEIGHAGAARAGDGRLRHAPRAARRAQLRLRPRQSLPARHASRAATGASRASRSCATTSRFDELAALKSAGVVGVAWNVTFYGVDHYRDARAARSTSSSTLDMFVDIQVEHDQLVAMHAAARRSPACASWSTTAAGPRSTRASTSLAFARCSSWRATRRAFVKLSGFVKFSREPSPHDDAWPFVDALRRRVHARALPVGLGLAVPARAGARRLRRAARRREQALPRRARAARVHVRQREAPLWLLIRALASRDREVALERGLVLRASSALAAACTTVPRSRITARSVIASTRAGFCSTTIADMPSSRTSDVITRSSSSTMSGARPFERLVEQQQSRIEHQRAADGEHLLLAAGKLRAEIAAALRATAETARTRVPASTGRGVPPRSGSPRP